MAMQNYALSPQPPRTHGGWWALLFLAVCLVAGLAAAEVLAPQPVIGVVRFADVIWTDTVDRLVQVIDAARQDDSVAAVVLELDSPGGLSTSSEKAFYALLALRQAKPLIVVVDGVAASGGYYMAVAANRIFAAPSSYVGNVGVRGGRPFDPALFPDELSTGPYKLSGGDRFDQIRQLELLKAAFVGNVVEQRRLSPVNPLKVDAAIVAEARIYVGSEALGIGYIDSEGSVSDAIAEAAKLAGVNDYQTRELLDYFGFEFPLVYQPPAQSLAAAATSRLASAGDGATYFLDSRIPLAAAFDATALQAHLLSLRAAAPEPLQFPNYAAGSASKERAQP